MTTRTPNAGLVVDPTGSNVDTWADNVTNPDFTAIDGLLAGVQTISVTNAPVTLTSPAGFTPTPGGGPTQAQNRVLRFTGTLTGNVPITLPQPGAYVVENLTTGNFVLSFRGVTATEVIGTPQGERVNIYNDGANVRFVGLARVGAMEMWAGLSAIPAWVSACTVAPYLLCDGSIHNFSDFPALSARLLGTFGGNGATTFGVPDMQGRVPLAYDGTGTRITVAGCGINGQTLGASLNTQTVSLAANQIPTIAAVTAAAITVNFGGNVPRTAGAISGSDYNNGSGALGANFPASAAGGVGDWNGISSASTSGAITATYTNNSLAVVNNVQPSIVTGIWVVKS